jgi:hypothetical protein
MAEKSTWDQANRRQKHGLAWKNRKKISQIIKDYFYLPFFLLIILGSYLTLLMTILLLVFFREPPAQSITIKMFKRTVLQDCQLPENGMLVIYMGIK